MELDYIRIPYKVSSQQFINAKEIYNYIIQSTEIEQTDNEQCFANLVINGFKSLPYVPFNIKKLYLKNLLTQYRIAFPQISVAEAEWINCYILCMCFSTNDITILNQLDEIYSTLPEYTPKNDTLKYFKQQIYVRMLGVYLTLDKSQDILYEKLEELK